MYRSGLVDMLVTHTNIEGFGLTPLSGDRRGYMPPLLKTKQDFLSLKTKPCRKISVAKGSELESYCSHQYFTLSKTKSLKTTC